MQINSKNYLYPYLKHNSFKVVFNKVLILQLSRGRTDPPLFDQLLYGSETVLALWPTCANWGFGECGEVWAGGHRVYTEYADKGRVNPYVYHTASPYLHTSSENCLLPSSPPRIHSRNGQSQWVKQAGWGWSRRLQPCQHKTTLWKTENTLAEILHVYTMTEPRN